MVKTNLPYTFIVKGRYWRFRRGELKAALPGQPGEPEFHARYAVLVAQSERKAGVVDRQSFKWLIGRYRKSAEYGALAPSTQLDYSRTLDLIDEKLGDQPFRYTTRAMVKVVRDDFAATPRKAHKIKQMVSRLYSWADEEELVPEDFNPVAKLKRLKAAVKHITPWSEEEIQLFMAHCPEHLITAVMLALYTGQRREDVVTMEWPAFQGAFIRVKQSKTGEPLDIACHRDLRKRLAATKTKFGGPIARAANGRPYSANSLSQAIRRVVDAIDDMPKDRSIHGLRYAAAGRLNAAGCTVTEASKVMGHRTYQMAIQYMAGREASQAAIAKQEKAEG